MPELNLSISEFAVSRAIAELDEGDGASIQEIADYIGCSDRTVRRAIKRLLEADKLQRHKLLRAEIGGYICKYYVKH